jgi:urease accessory protein
LRRFSAAIVAMLIAQPAFAHADPSAHASAAAGFFHPLLGADHLLAMVAVGVLAAVQPRRWAQFALPAAFVAGMAAGIVMAMFGIVLPLAEPMILASIFTLGAILALSVRLPVLGGMAMVGLFGVFHGTAHGLEIGSASALPFGLAVLAATAVLHGAGAALGAAILSVLRSQSTLMLRVFGAGLGLSGLALAFG